MSIPNLLFILQECSAIKGKGLEGEFVYAWDGPELVLLPVDSKEYKSSLEFTSLKKEKVSKKDLVPGCIYLTKDMEQQIYLGSFVMWGKLSKWDSIEGERQYIFVNLKNIEDKSLNLQHKYVSFSKFERKNETRHIAKAVTSVPDADLFSRLYTEFNSFCAKNNIDLGNPTALEYSPLNSDKRLNIFDKMKTAAGYYYGRDDIDRYSKPLYLEIEHMVYKCSVTDIGTASTNNNRNYYYNCSYLSDEEQANAKNGKAFKVTVKGYLKTSSAGIEVKKSETMKVLYFSKEELETMMMDVNVIIESGKRINLIDIQKD